MLPRTAGWGPIALVLGALFPAACSSGGGGGNGDASPGSASPEPFATLAALNLQQGSFLKIGIPATPVPTALVVKSESVRALASIDLSDPDRPSSRRSWADSPQTGFWKGLRGSPAATRSPESSGGRRNGTSAPKDSA